MKLIVFFGVIILSFLFSTAVIRNGLRNKNRPSHTIFKAAIVNLVVLGSGSLWWFLTETDGISQGIGLWILAGSFAATMLVNVVHLLSRRHGIAKA